MVITLNLLVDAMVISLVDFRRLSDVRTVCSESPVCAARALRPVTSCPRLIGFPCHSPSSQFAIKSRFTNSQPVAGSACQPQLSRERYRAIKPFCNKRHHRPLLAAVPACSSIHARKRSRGMSSLRPRRMAGKPSLCASS